MSRDKPNQSIPVAPEITVDEAGKQPLEGPPTIGTLKRTLGWYNGFSPSQRMRVLRAMNLSLASGMLPPAQGPCNLCGDPNTPVFYHSEDYSEPLSWVAPAAYCLCQLCHLRRVHMRFTWPLVWAVHLAHVRRGGYSGDLKRPEIKRQLASYRRGIETGVPTKLPMLRPYALVVGQEWFAALSTDPRSRVLGTAIGKVGAGSGLIAIGVANSRNQLRSNPGAAVVGRTAHEIRKPET